MSSSKDPPPGQEQCPSWPLVRAHQEPCRVPLRRRRPPHPPFRDYGALWSIIFLNGLLWDVPQILNVLTIIQVQVLIFEGDGWWPRLCLERQSAKPKEALKKLAKSSYHPLVDLEVWQQHRPHRRVRPESEVFNRRWEKPYRSVYNLPSSGLHLPGALPCWHCWTQQGYFIFYSQKCTITSH